MGLDCKGLFGRFLCLVVLAVFCFIEQAYLVLGQDIAFLLAGLAVLDSLGIGKDLIHVLQLPFQLCIFLL